jgi:uncharacterized protein (UPF0276 family)
MSPSAGLTLKPQHFADAHACPADDLWFEVHPENYMVAGGPRLAWLETIREDHAISLHAVALSLAADAPVDGEHLRKLATLADRIEPAMISEHLAWSRWRGIYHPDLLPFPRSTEALERVVNNIDRVQSALGRRIAIENPSHYVRLDGHDYGEIEFLSELARRTGCGLLLDVNNVYVSARNLGYSADGYIDTFPGAAIAEVHLAGHTQDPSLGDGLLVDSHDSAVAQQVWRLYERLIRRIGPRPTLIERDGNVPPFQELLVERERAQSVLAATTLDVPA